MSSSCEDNFCIMNGDNDNAADKNVLYLHEPGDTNCRVGSLTWWEKWQDNRADFLSATTKHEWYYHLVVLTNLANSLCQYAGVSLLALRREPSNVKTIKFYCSGRNILRILSMFEMFVHSSTNKLSIPCPML